MGTFGGGFLVEYLGFASASSIVGALMVLAVRRSHKIAHLLQIVKYFDSLHRAA